MSVDSLHTLPLKKQLAFWCLTKGAVLPSEPRLLQDLAEVVDVNLALDAELRAKGKAASPIWENFGGVAGVRLVHLPESIVEKYYDKAANDLRSPSVHRLIVKIMPAFFADITMASVALEDTLQLWIEPEAPSKSLGRPYQPHFMMVSALLADFARKCGSGLDLPEFLMSIGVFDLFDLGRTYPDADSIHESMTRKIDEMWENENACFEQALDSE